MRRDYEEMARALSETQKALVVATDTMKLAAKHLDEQKEAIAELVAALQEMAVAAAAYNWPKNAQFLVDLIAKYRTQGEGK